MLLTLPSSSQKIYPKVSVIEGDTIVCLHKTQVDIINEDLEELKFYRIQAPVYDTRIQTLEDRIKEKDFQIKLGEMVAKEHAEKFDLAEKALENNYNTVMENGRLKKWNNRLTIAASVAFTYIVATNIK
jgi:hypothetical protein